MRKGEVTIAEMHVNVTVISFAFRMFTSLMIEEIKDYISKNPFTDDLTMNGGQITVDEMQNIIYTGSAAAATYIAMAYKRKSLSKKYTITVYRKTIPEHTVPLIMAMVANHKPERRKSKARPLQKHNLHPVLDEIKKEKTKI